jgi:hypothetical protein
VTGHRRRIVPRWNAPPAATLAMLRRLVWASRSLPPAVLVTTRPDPSREPLDEVLARAIASGLVRRDPAGTVGFSHDLFREVTYGELAEAERRVMHAYWSSPTFKKINRVLSTAWGLAIFAVGASRVAAAAIDGHTTRRWSDPLYRDVRGQPRTGPG